MRAKACVALVCFGAGCGEGNGSDLGIFEVDAVRTESCGDAGLLGSPPEAQLRVWLRRVGSTAMHWDDGTGRLMGDYDADAKSFVIQKSLVVDARVDHPGDFPCSIERIHTIEATLDADPSVATKFEGELRFDYTPTEGSTCDDLLTGEAAIASALPCAVAYDLAAVRR